jgi:hypothetical protein
MAVALTINGVIFQYPEDNDDNWGSAATGWAQAVTAGMLQKTGGSFTLTSEVDFGALFGVSSLYVKSRTANGAAAGQIRLARADTVNFRNEANSADLPLGVNASDQLTFDGSVIQGAVSVTDTATIDLTFASNVLSADIVSGSITNAMINASAAIDLTKLAALTASRAVITSGAGVLSASSVTSTELGYVSGVTSALQTQLNAKVSQPTLYSLTLPPAAPTVDGQVLSSTTLGVASWTTVVANAAPSVQRFLSGSGTYTTPAGVLYIKVRMAGGGGGGRGTGGDGGNGGNTTFGTSLLTANGGVGGTSSATGGLGGTVTVNSPAVDVSSRQGGQGGAGLAAVTATQNYG